ncbi:MAG TPA: type II toxin-antitoxin system VapC family toxin [Actinomycetales bacterium]|nr:type II toxin-antitoxin system VapC family toxin [Actinomycetales bacterium]
MIGLDTNVLVRYVVQDDDEQSLRATRLIESLDDERPGFVSLVVLVELHWVLRRAYGVTAADSAAVVRALLDSEEVGVAESDTVRRALSRVPDGEDLVDALIGALGEDAGCAYTVTFDLPASRLAGMRLVPTS